MNMLSISEILLYGTGVCILFSAVLAFVVLVNPRIMLHDAPPEVQANLPPQTHAEKRQAYLLMLPLLAGIALIMAHSSAQIIARSGGDTPFLALFANAYLVFLVLNLFDLVVIDYLVLLVWKPKFMVMPGGEAMMEMRTLNFHIAGFFKGMVIGLVFALITTLAAIAIG